MVKVAVCICTCRRPEGLERLLRALARLDWPERLEIVVVDNDEAEAGRGVCERLLAEGYRWPLSHALEPKRGISPARNRAVAMALAKNVDFIAMLDDDEWPERQWLAELIRVQREQGADLVGGPVLPELPASRASWIDAVVDECYGADQKLPDGAPCKLWASGNFLGRAACFAALMPEVFRAEFGLSGGEDFEFFWRLGAMGYTMRWAANAVAHEAVPESRMTIDWVRRRMVVKGNAQVRIFRLHAPSRMAEAVRLAKTGALFATGFGQYLLGLARPDIRMRGQLRLWRALGKLQAHVGRTMTRPERIEGR